MDYLGTIGLLIGITSIILAVVYNRKQRYRKKIGYVISNKIIFDKNLTIDKLNVQYDHKRLEGLGVTSILVANIGYDSIEGEALSSIDPLRIVVGEGFEVLELSITYTDNKSIKLDRASSQEGLINFEFLNSNEAFVIDFIHTGSPTQQIDLLGKIRNVKSFTKIDPYSSYSSAISLILFVGIIVISIFDPFWKLFDNVNLAQLIVGVIFITALSVSALFNMKGKLLKYPHVHKVYKKALK